MAILNKWQKIKTKFISTTYTFVNIPALLLKNKLRYLIRAGIFTKVWIGDIVERWLFDFCCLNILVSFCDSNCFCLNVIKVSYKDIMIRNNCQKIANCELNYFAHDGRVEIEVSFRTISAEPCFWTKTTNLGTTVTTG